jgi:hypothetical protein
VYVLLLCTEKRMTLNKGHRIEREILILVRG